MTARMMDYYIEVSIQGGSERQNIEASRCYSLSLEYKATYCLFRYGGLFPSKGPVRGLAKAKAKALALAKMLVKMLVKMPVKTLVKTLVKMPVE